MKSKTIQALSFYKYKQFFLHFNNLPFLIIYPLSYSCKICKIYFLDYYNQGESQIIFIFIIIEVLLHLIFTLSTLWSVSLKTFFQYSSCNYEEANFVFIQAKSHKGIVNFKIY